MSGFIDQAITFLALTGALLAGLIIYAFYKAGWSKEQFMINWNMAEGKKSPLKAMGYILLIPIVIAFFLYMTNVEADEIKWFDGASVYVGVDVPAADSPFCQDGNVSNKATSNMGFVQDIASSKHFNVGAKYTHHSCALNSDVNTYDAVGIILEWKIY